MLPTEVVWGVISLRQAGVRIHSRKIHSSWKKKLSNCGIDPYCLFGVFQVKFRVR